MTPSAQKNRPGVYTYKGWILVVAPSEACTVIGAIATTFLSRAKALVWIDGRPPRD